MDLVLELKNNASKLLLAIMESRTADPENVAEKIIFNMNPKQLASGILFILGKYLKALNFEIFFRLKWQVELTINKYWMMMGKSKILIMKRVEFHPKLLAIISTFCVIR